MGRKSQKVMEDKESPLIKKTFKIEILRMVSR
jgi:hypothetical protein